VFSPVPYEVRLDYRRASLPGGVPKPGVHPALRKRLTDWTLGKTATIRYYLDFFLLWTCPKSGCARSRLPSRCELTCDIEANNTFQSYRLVLVKENSYNNKDLLSSHRPQRPTLLHVCPPSPLLTPVLTKNKNTPTVRTLRASDFFKFPYNSSASKLKHLPAAEMLSRKPKRM